MVELADTKFVLLYRCWAILEFTLVMWWITLVRTQVDVLIMQAPLVNALFLSNLCEYRRKSQTRFF